MDISVRNAPDRHRYEAYAGDVLVVLSLHGGVDGLSVIPPVGDPNYATLRPTIGIPGSLALPLGSPEAVAAR